MLYVWGIISGSILFLLSYQQWISRKKFDLLRDCPVPEATFRFPKVSLIVPACNEADTIGSALSSLLKMDYPNLELIVVNDRSTDATSTVIREIQARDPRVNLVEVTTLPDGWLGKLHAVHCGVKAASGDWFLFSDADVHYEKNSLRRAMAYVMSKEVDFLTVVPAMRANTFLLRAVISHFLQSAMLAVDITKVRNPNCIDCAGGGAFNLIRRTAYERSRGFEWIKLDVIDDTGIAMVVKQAGAKCDALGGLGEIELEWYPTFAAYAKGLEKNSFGIFEYSLTGVIIYVIIHALLFFGFSLAPFLAHSLALAIFDLAAVAVFIGTTYHLLKKVMPFSAWIAVIVPFMYLVNPLIALRAAILFTWRGGIYWRGTFYSRAALIANQKFKISEILKTKFRQSNIK